MPPSAPEPGLHRKLLWLTFFRIATVTVLLGGTLLFSWRTRGEAEAIVAPLYAVIVVVYAASILIAMALRRERATRAIALLQIVLDVAVAAVVVATTGREESIFVFLFSLGVVNGAILLFRTGALIGAVLAFLGYLAAVALPPPLHLPPAQTAFVHASAFLLTAGLAGYLAEQLRSTGERLAARESDLAALTALHQSVVESLTSGLLTLDPSGCVTYMNPAAEQMTGVVTDQARGRPVGEVVAFPAGGGRDETEYVNPRGERLLLGYSVFPLRTREGLALGSAAIFQDLTRLHAMEEAMRRTSRLADLGRVAAGLAHELRNPLASLSGSVELLRSLAPAQGDEQRLLDIALRETARLEQLVTAFLSFARPPPLRRRETDVAALLEETLAVFRNDPVAQGLTLHADLVSTVVSCDPDQIRQVAWNLLRNAAQAIASRPRGAPGTIRVRAGPSPAGGSFAVADDGPGIPSADRDRLFLPFHTTREGGTGLGLATIHRIVDEHGGRIEVLSTEGQGAEFIIYLEAAQPRGSSAAAS